MESFNIVLSPCAVASIEEIYDYICNVLKEPESAFNTIQKIYNVILSLKVLPNRIKISSAKDLKEREIRIIYANNYAILFCIKGPDIVIIDVVYSKSNIEAKFEK